MTIAAGAAAAVSAPCPACGTDVAAALLVCPGCHRRVHGDIVKEYAARAESALAEGNHEAALTAWRSALDLLPAGSRQHAWVTDKITALSQRAGRADGAAIPQHHTAQWKWIAALGPAALLIWKFKFLAVALLTKGKLLLLGLTKMSTVTSMFVAVGVYWTQWGLWFALGVVVSIYIHEMGHVAALQRYGIAASAPMFIPGFGAFVRMKQMPASAHEAARVGLAGPLWGTGAAVAALAAALATGSGLWAAIAVTGGVLNLFNLMPVWQLDGSRAFASLTRAQRWVAAAAVAVAWMATGDGLVLLVLLVAIARAIPSGGSQEPDRGALAQYVGITLALAAIVSVSRTLL